MGCDKWNHKAKLTGLSNEQEEPHTSRKVKNQRDRIARVPQQVNDREESPVELRLEPARLNRRALEHRMRWWVMRLSGAAYERGSKAPSEAD